MKLKPLVLANTDRVIALGFVVAGAVLLVVAWFGVSSKALAPEQIPFLVSGGLGGIFLGAIGCTIWLSADLQDEWRRLDGIEDALSKLTRSDTVSTDLGDLAKANGRTPTTRVGAKTSQ